MYLKFYFLAIFKVMLIFAGPPYIGGLIYGLVKKKYEVKPTYMIGIGYVLFVEIFVLIEKGMPFFWSNIYFMFALSPIVWLQYVIGIGGAILWIVFGIGFAKSGINQALRLTSRKNSAE